MKKFLYCALAVILLSYPAIASVTVELNETSIEIPYDGSSRQLTAKVWPEGASQSVTWSSSDTNVVTVSASGLLKGIAPGVAVITARAQNGEAACTVTVTHIAPNP